MQQQRTGMQQFKGMTDERALRQEQLLECPRHQNKTSVAEASERIEKSRR